MEARDFISDLTKAGMTQAQIAERVGLVQATVSKIARGDVHDVMSRSYRRLAALHAEVVKSADGAATERKAA